VDLLNPLEFKIARIRLGLTQHELGQVLGNIPAYVISRWETGWSEPPAEILARFAKLISENPKPALEVRKHEARRR
jgi:DNA-binding transcriptional regulator YiaG